GERFRANEFRCLKFFRIRSRAGRGNAALPPCFGVRRKDSEWLAGLRQEFLLVPDHCVLKGFEANPDFVERIEDTSIALLGVRFVTNVGKDRVSFKFLRELWNFDFRFSKTDNESRSKLGQFDLLNFKRM